MKLVLLLLHTFIFNIGSCLNLKLCYIARASAYQVSYTGATLYLLTPSIPNAQIYRDRLQLSYLC